MDENGVVYAWNQGQDPEGSPRSPELVAVSGPDAEHEEPYVLWSVHLPPTDGERWETTEWSSTVLVLNNMVVGTITHMNAITAEDLPIPLPLRTAHELVGVRRSDGEILWRGVPMPDDSINAPFMGSDGNIYVPILGMLDFAHFPGGRPPESCDEFEEEFYQGGIVQFVSPR
jgi:outer membrane protein assembly factor BamB